MLVYVAQAMMQRQTLALLINKYEGEIMGVMACDRNGCDKIMCDYYASEHGYICPECLEELKNGRTRSIDIFMETPKTEKEYSDYEGWCDYVDEVFDTRGGL